MKLKLIFMSLFLFIVFSSIAFAETMPREKIIVGTVVGDFLDVKGQAIPSPVDSKKIKNAILKSIATLGWTVVSVKDNEIIYKITNPKWWVITKIAFNRDGYIYSYIDSENIVKKQAPASAYNYNSAFSQPLPTEKDYKFIIHKNYLKQWIPDMERNIGINYYID